MLARKSCTAPTIIIGSGSSDDLIQLRDVREAEVPSGTPTLHRLFRPGRRQHAKSARHEVLKDQVRLSRAAALVLAKVGHIDRWLRRVLREWRLEVRRRCDVTLLSSVLLLLRLLLTSSPVLERW